jgi:hypothetical protein
MMHKTLPLTDITNSNLNAVNIQCGLFSPEQRFSCESTLLSPEVWSPAAAPVLRRQNDPYAWKCLPDDESQAIAILAQRSQLSTQRNLLKRLTCTKTHEFNNDTKLEAEDVEISLTAESSVCRCLVQFKCHQAEFSSGLLVEKGQYVVVQGDRGIDIGVVIRVNTPSSKSYIERTGPSGSILRHATQREVDYWASELKADEAAALEFCRQRIIRHQLVMEVRHAEYQFDKKKLTFYYDAKSRVDFVNLLKELYREYGCRIWMEKVRPHE